MDERANAENGRDRDVDLLVSGASNGPMLNHRNRPPGLMWRLHVKMVFLGGRREKALWNLHAHSAKGSRCIIYRDGEKYSFEGFSSGDQYILKREPLVYLEGCNEQPSRTYETVIEDVGGLLRKFGFNKVVLDE